MGKAVKDNGTVTDEKKALSVLSDYVIFYEEPVIVSEMCFFTAGEDYEKVMNASLEVFGSVPEFSYPVRRAAVKKALEQCFKENKVLNFEGFLTFRLAEYEALLFMGINAAVFKTMLENEYDEMCSELSFYVKDNETKISEAHIYGYCVTDENGEKLTSCEDEIFSPDDFVTEADRLLGLLICLSPKRIFIHIPPDDETLETVQRIFGFLIYA